MGTPHLKNIEDKFSPSLLDSLINVLEEYNPDAIGLEEISGGQVAHMKRRGGHYNSTVQYFGSKALKYGKERQKHLNVTWEEADIIADSLMNTTRRSSSISDNERGKFVNYLLASYQPYSAALQWSYIDEKGALKQWELPKSTAKVLTAIVNSASESASIGIRIAHDLGLQRIYPIDDNMEKDYLNKIVDQVDKALLADSLVQVIKNAPYQKRYRQLLKEGVKSKNLFPLYKYMNSDAFLEQDQRIQWRETFLETKNYNTILNKRLALWEVRNLNIAAHIRKASSKAVGGRILIIIGASHKPFLDNYLKEMMGIEVVQLSDITNN